LVYYGRQQQLEYEFIVAPGADPRVITLAFQGADRLELDAKGDLLLHLAGETVRQYKHYIYQEVGASRQEIAGGYVLKEGGQVGFQVGPYDASLPLVIDPAIIYSTKFGGIGLYMGAKIAVDATGNAYVAGSDYRHYEYNYTFVAKLTPDGTQLVFFTILGPGERVPTPSQ
jgi:hypothetical protein